MTRVAIMQPTYLPWLGYFGLMESVDVFILLDSVQFARRSWQQRNQIKTANGPLWLTVPVVAKGKRDQLISEVEIDLSQDFPRSHQRAIEMSYRRAPYYSAYSDQLLSVIGADTKLLSEMTIAAIVWIRDELGITTHIRRASEFVVEGTKADLLANICEQVGATEYVSPPGSKRYLDESDAFAKRNLPLSYFHFEHQEYPQRYGEFISCMSIIDLMFNVGQDSLRLLKMGSRIVAEDIETEGNASEC
jgi:hypothetical protein